MTTLLVDDDATLRAMLKQAFEIEDMDVTVVADPGAALGMLNPGFDGVVVTDVRMPGMSGLELFHRIRNIDPDIPVIVMTGHADVPMAIETLKQGAFDFIPKPFAADHLISSVRRASERRALVMENRALRAAAERADAGEPLIGEAPAIVRLRDTIRQLAQADVDVLVEGETGTGTGKEMAALLLHRWSPRRTRPFIAVNCAALPPGLAEAELFGYAPGVHVQYRGGHQGRIEASSGGTLFLDEVASMPLSVQGTMLRVIEEHEVAVIGGDRPRPVDLRVAAATNTDLAAAVASGAFRNDLYYRLNTVHVRVPALRERLADAPLLFAHYLAEEAARMGVEVPVVSRDIHQHIAANAWPGNVRELRSYARRVLLGVHVEAQDGDHGATDLAEQVAGFEAGVIRRAMERAGGDVALVQERLGLARNTLYDKLKRYGIKPVDFR